MVRRAGAGLSHPSPLRTGIGKLRERRDPAFVLSGGGVRSRAVTHAPDNALEDARQAEGVIGKLELESGAVLSAGEFAVAGDVLLFVRNAVARLVDHAANARTLRIVGRHHP